MHWTRFVIFFVCSIWSCNALSAGRTPKNPKEPGLASDMPLEIWKNILDHLQPNERNSIAAISHDLYQAILHLYPHWVVHAPKGVLPRFFTQLEKSPEHIVMDITIHKPKPRNIECLMALQPRVRNLTLVGLRLPSMKDVFVHLCHMNQLQKLTLNGFKNLTDDELPKLSGLSSLTELNLGICCYITEAAVKRLLNLTNLKKLYLKYCDLDEYRNQYAKKCLSKSNLTVISKRNKNDFK